MGKNVRITILLCKKNEMIFPRLALHPDQILGGSRRQITLSASSGIDHPTGSQVFE